MLCTNKDNSARAYVAQVAAAPEPSTGIIETRRQKLTAVHTVASPDPTPPPAPIAPSNRVYNWSVGVGLAILIALLAAVLWNAGINVEVLP